MFQIQEFNKELKSEKKVIKIIAIVIICSIEVTMKYICAKKRR